MLRKRWNFRILDFDPCCKGDTVFKWFYLVKKIRSIQFRRLVSYWGECPGSCRLMKFTHKWCNTYYSSVTFWHRILAVKLMEQFCSDKTTTWRTSRSWGGNVISHSRGKPISDRVTMAACGERWWEQSHNCFSKEKIKGTGMNTV